MPQAQGVRPIRPATADTTTIDLHGGVSGMVASGRNQDGQKEREEGRALGSPSGTSDPLAQHIVPIMQVVFFSFLLAMPFMAFTISVDIGFGGRWMCEPTAISDITTVHDRNGEPICQFEIHSALLFWTFWAAAVSPVPILVVYVRHVSKQLQRLGAAGDNKAQESLSRRFFIDIGLCVLFAAVVGQGWPLSFIILPGAALAMYVYRLRAARRNEANS